MREMVPERLVGVLYVPRPVLQCQPGLTFSVAASSRAADVDSMRKSSTNRSIIRPPWVKTATKSNIPVQVTSPLLKTTSWDLFSSLRGWKSCVYLHITLLWWRRKQQALQERTADPGAATPLRGQTFKSKQTSDYTCLRRLFWAGKRARFKQKQGIFPRLPRLTRTTMRAGARHNPAIVSQTGFVNFCKPFAFNQRRQQEVRRHRRRRPNLKSSYKKEIASKWTLPLNTSLICFPRVGDPKVHASVCAQRVVKGELPISAGSRSIFPPLSPWKLPSRSHPLDYLYKTFTTDQRRRSEFTQTTFNILEMTRGGATKVNV